MSETLAENEKEQIKICIASIEEMLHAIKQELEKTNSYKYYMKAKNDNIYFYSKKIKNVCKEAEND